MFAALTMPEVRDYISSKVTKFLACAPIVYLEHIASPLLENVAQYLTPIEELSELFDVYEIVPGACSKTSAQSKFETAVCKYVPQICDDIIVVSDTHPECDNLDRMTYFTNHIPSGSSTQNFFHYAQFINQPKPSHPVFRMYNYGLVGNMKHYGQANPPLLDLSKISKKIKIVGFVGGWDKLGNSEDEKILAADLKKFGVNYKTYFYPKMGHLTFAIAKDPTDFFADFIKEVESN
jgi:hypothetical protein